MCSSYLMQQIQPLSGISAMPMPWPQWGRIQKPFADRYGFLRPVHRGKCPDRQSDRVQGVAAYPDGCPDGGASVDPVRARRIVFRTGSCSAAAASDPDAGAHFPFCQALFAYLSAGIPLFTALRLWFCHSAGTGRQSLSLSGSCGVRCCQYRTESVFCDRVSYGGYPALL